MNTIKYKNAMINKITICPNGDVKVTMANKDKEFENEVIDFAEKFSEKIKRKINDNLKLKVEIKDGKVKRIRSTKYNWTALVYATEVK
ncbi:MAG: hypothetical protein SLAVMIC_00253 [uncultured marine phage]|uniref:Uncharacterized protein n=1 Tax=uncultured marine phage TaxID=707152 RepID=A0A8D9FQ30_9VIRU|nr:MAG: hypothetical protein SLAVMIC_00253 [uncultured marine phage]